MPDHLRYALLDVFTDTPLQGNGLAVFTGRAREELLQPIATAIGLSETVFLSPAEQGGTARVRIFTPAEELPFAGHPVLGTAHLLAERSRLDEVVLETGRGPVPIAIERTGPAIGRCEMVQPVPDFLEPPAAALVEQALGVPLVGALALADNGPRHVFAPVATLDIAERYDELAAIPATTVVAYLPPADGRVRVRVLVNSGRFEDPATGSAAGPLAQYLLAQGAIGPGRLTIEQGVEMGRPSVIEATVAPGEPPRVGGRAVIIGGGELLL